MILSFETSDHLGLRNGPKKFYFVWHAIKVKMFIYIVFKYNFETTFQSELNQHHTRLTKRVTLFVLMLYTLAMYFKIKHVSPIPLTIYLLNTYYNSILPTSSTETLRSDFQYIPPLSKGTCSFKRDT